jgi:hypothetical protein
MKLQLTALPPEVAVSFTEAPDNKLPTVMIGDLVEVLKSEELWPKSEDASSPGWAGAFGAIVAVAAEVPVINPDALVAVDLERI